MICQYRSKHELSGLYSIFYFTSFYRVSNAESSPPRNQSPCRWWIAAQLLCTLHTYILANFQGNGPNLIGTMLSTYHRRPASNSTLVHYSAGPCAVVVHTIKHVPRYICKLFARAAPAFLERVVLVCTLFTVTSTTLNRGGLGTRWRFNCLSGSSGSPFLFSRMYVWLCGYVS